MPKLPKARAGKELEIRGRRLEFSNWPTYQGTKRIGIQSRVFALDPWTIVKAAIKEMPNTISQAEAAAYVEQARDFYGAATSGSVTAARPLLLYYCFLNLAKALVLHRNLQPSLPRATHGLKERLVSPNRELEDAYLRAETTKGANISVFAEFVHAIRGHGLTADQDFQLVHLLPQILSGHRLWAEAADQSERFIAIDDIVVMQSKTRKQLWLNLYLVEADLTRFGITHKSLVTQSGLNGLFRQIKTTRTSDDGRKLFRLEQVATVTYNHRPSDDLNQLVASIRSQLWATVASIPPYRRYYLYLVPTSEAAAVLPQLASIYAVTFYLGSITRYRPHHFDSIVASRYGARVEEFISGQPLQFIYLVASEFAKQEVTKPSIV